MSEPTTYRTTVDKLKVGDIIRAELDTANVITGEIVAKEKRPSQFAAGVVFDRLWVVPIGTITGIRLDGPWLNNLTYIRRAANAPIDGGEPA
jgi:hypothetical protein